MTARTTVRVWDLSTRLFHWGLAATILVACVSAHRDDDAALRVHFVAGYGALALVLFRLLWGFAGPHYARFAQFVRGPARVRAYLRGLRGAPGPVPNPAWPGHNPLGALSVLALLALCLGQAASGLFTSDAVVSEGPLAHYVSTAAVDRLSRLHAIGEWVLYGAIGAHLLAVLLYAVLGRENLVRPMLTGARPLAGHRPDAVDTRDDAAMRVRALGIALLCAAAVVFVATRATG